MARLQSLFNRIVCPDAWRGANICRIEALRQVGGFEKNIKGAAEDVDIMARIRKKGCAREPSCIQGGKYLRKYPCMSLFALFSDQ